MRKQTSETHAMFILFCEALEGADQVVVETKNAFGGSDNQSFHAATLRDAIKNRDHTKEA